MLLLRLARLEQVPGRVRPQPRTENALRLRPEKNLTRLPVQLGLVTGGSVDPDRSGRVEVAPAHHERLARPHPGQPLELDDRPELAREVRPDGVDVALGGRLDHP